MEVSTVGRWRLEEGRLRIGRGSKGWWKCSFFFFLSEVMPLLLAESKALPSHTGTSRRIQTAVAWYAPALLSPDTVSRLFPHI